MVQKDFSMPYESASHIGFCVVDSNADLIADTLVRRIREAAAELESDVNRLYRGRSSYDLNAVAKVDLEKTIKRLNYLAETLRDVQRSQVRVTLLQAAE
jgi:hypothetical protein